MNYNKKNMPIILFKLHFSFNSFIVEIILLNFSVNVIDGIFSVYESELVESSSFSAILDFKSLYLFIE